MILREWIDRQRKRDPSWTQKGFASQVGVREETLCGYMSHPPRRRAILEVALRIEQLTGGEVQAETFVNPKIWARLLRRGKGRRAA
jgi:hypothetical protein